MKQGKIIGFNAAKMAEQMMANAVAEQNRRLVEYWRNYQFVQQQTPHG